MNGHNRGGEARKIKAFRAPGVEKFGVFSAVADLFNLEVDLIFLDTTSTFFEIEGEDPDEEGLRKWGFSKDKRSDLAHVVVGFAVTRTGIPVRSWVWPGNTTDESVIAEVKRDLNGWKLGRVVVVADTGFNSEENRRILQGAGGHYILGEKLRLGAKGLPAEALGHAGSYRTLDNGLEVKEVVVGGDSEARRRFVFVRNTEEVERDRRKREDILAEAERRLAELEQLDGEPHRKAACRLRAHPALGRYIRQTRIGKLRLDRAKIRREERFDGKFLVSSSDDSLSAEDIVLGYKQLAAVERVFRDLGHRVDIRPVYHRLADRIQADVLLCWLGLLLIRVAENETGETWHDLRRILEPLKLGIHGTPSGEVRRQAPRPPGRPAFSRPSGWHPRPAITPCPSPGESPRRHNARAAETGPKPYSSWSLATFRVPTCCSTADEAVHLIHQFAKGILRRINNAATACLLAGFVEQKSLIDETTARKALGEFRDDLAG